MAALYFAYYWLTILGDLCFSQHPTVCGLKESFDTKNLKEIADLVCESLNAEGRFGLLIHLYLKWFFCGQLNRLFRTGYLLFWWLCVGFLCLRFHI
jgi:hypothetical protein